MLEGAQPYRFKDFIRIYGHRLSIGERRRIKNAIKSGNDQLLKSFCRAKTAEFERQEPPGENVEIEEINLILGATKNLSNLLRATTTALKTEIATKEGVSTGKTFFGAIMELEGRNGLAHLKEVLRDVYGGMIKDLGLEAHVNEEYKKYRSIKRNNERNSKTTNVHRP